MASKARGGQAATPRAARWSSWRALTLACVALAFAAPGVTRAEGGPRVELELGSGWARDGQGGTASFWSPAVTVSGRAGAKGAVWVRAGGTAAQAAGGVGFAAGNLTLGWAEQLGLGLVGKVAAVAPTARRGEGLDALAESGARAIRGHSEAWQWLGDHAAVVGSLTWALTGGGWLVEAQPSLAFMIPTQEREGTDGLVRGEGFAFEVRLRAALRVTGPLWFALAGCLAWTPTVTRDATAWSVVPELRWVASGGTHLSLGAIVNLDAPWGPSWVRDAGLADGESDAGRGATGLRLGGAWRF
jgi:hypothetical protein